MIKRQMYGRADFTLLLATASSSADATNRHHRKCDRAVKLTDPWIGCRRVLWGSITGSGLDGLAGWDHR
jgi:hypothetical protein